MGMMDVWLFVLDVDIGKKCVGFVDDGVFDVNCWNIEYDKWLLLLL